MSILESLRRFSVKDALQMPIGQFVETTLDVTPKLLAELKVELALSGHCAIGATHIDDGVKCGIWFRGVADTVCVRCATPTVTLLDHRIDTYYTYQHGDDVYPISSMHTIDLVQQCVDTIVQSWPEYPLCRLNCHGICPTCGVNLNDHSTHFKRFKDHQTNGRIVNSIKIK